MHGPDGVIPSPRLGQDPQKAAAVSKIAAQAFRARDLQGRVGGLAGTRR